MPGYKDDKGRRFSVDLGEPLRCDECPAAIVDETIGIVYDTWAAAEQLKQPVTGGPAWWDDVARLYGSLRRKHESELVRISSNG